VNWFKRLFGFGVPDVPTKFWHAPENYRLPDHSTKEHPWCFPPGRPYQVYDGPHGGVKGKMQVWTSERELPGYDLIEDHYSDRLYHVWRGE
jgi:hypothetical protein